MSGAGRQHLQINNAGYDVPFFENGGRLVEYREPVTHENNVIEQDDFSPVSNQNTWGYGNTIKFQLDRKADYYGEIEFIMTRSADLTGTISSFLDFEGYQSIDYVEVYSDNVPAMRYYGEHMLIDLLQEGSDIERHIAADINYGYRYPVERVELARVPLTTITKLRLPFSSLDRHIPAHTFSSKLNFDITLKSLKDCCRNSGGSSFNISNPILRVQGLHLQEESKVEDWQKVWSPTGLPIKIKDREIHRKEQITTSSGIQRIKLNNIKNAVYNLKFYLRKQSDLNDNATLTTTNFQSCSTFWLEENGNKITPVFEMNDPQNATTGDYSVTVNNHRLYPEGQKGLGVACIPFVKPELVKHSDKDCFGSRSFNGYNNLELVLNFNTAPTQGLYCDIIGEIHQIMIWQNGQIRPYVK